MTNLPRTPTTTEKTVEGMVRRVLRPDELAAGEEPRLAFHPVPVPGRFVMLVPPALLTDGRLTLDITPVGQPRSVLGVPLIPFAEHASRVRRIANPGPTRKPQIAPPSLSAITNPKLPPAPHHSVGFPSASSGSLGIAVEFATRSFGSHPDVVRIHGDVTRGRPTVCVTTRCEPAIARQRCGLPLEVLGFPVVVRAA